MGVSNQTFPPNSILPPCFSMSIKAALNCSIPCLLCIGPYSVSSVNKNTLHSHLSHTNMSSIQTCARHSSQIVRALNLLWGQHGFEPSPFSHCLVTVSKLFMQYCSVPLMLCHTFEHVLQNVRRRASSNAVLLYYFYAIQM